ncbi:MAG: TolC family protein [Phycisphaerae bacterium]
MIKYILVLILMAPLIGCGLYRGFRDTPPVCRSKAVPPQAGTDVRAIPERLPNVPTTQSAQAITLQECIDKALAHNGGIRITDRRILIAQDRIREAWAIDLPKLTAQGRFDIQEKARAPGPTATAQKIAAITGTTPRIPMIDRDVSSVSTSLLVPIYNFGLGYHQREAARIGVGVSDLMSERARQDLILNVKQAYFRVLEARKIRDVVMDSIQTVTRQLEIARDFLSQGLVAKNDVLVVQVQLAQRKQQLIEAENNIQLAMSTLDRLMDESVTREWKLDDILEVPRWRGNFETVFLLAVRNRPDLEALRKQIKITEEQYRSTRAGLAPQINGYLNYNYSAVKNVEDKDAAVGGFFVDLPIFDGGLTYAQLARLSKQINEAIDVQSETEKDIILNVKQAYLVLNAAAEQIPVAKISIEQATENLRITRDQYAQGLLTSQDVLLQENALSQTRSNYYQALYAYHQSFAVLVNAIGGQPPEIPNSPLKKVKNKERNK